MTKRMNNDDEDAGRRGAGVQRLVTNTSTSRGRPVENLGSEAEVGLTTPVVPCCAWCLVATNPRKLSFSSEGASARSKKRELLLKLDWL